MATVAAVLGGVALVACVALGYRAVQQEQRAQRGILTTELPPSRMPTGAPYGVNVALEQYSEQDLQRTLRQVQAAGFTWVRQRFPWSEIEPQPGQFDWARWDGLVDAAERRSLNIIALLDTCPAWARSPTDRENRLAPPQYATTYGLFVRAFAERYSGRIAAFQVWDQPNIAPYWGAGNADPSAYTRLLRIASAEIRRADASAIVLSAALAPNTEAGGRNLSDVLFLRGMYLSGGKGWFDALGAKAYGFWSGPEDRRADGRVLNFSRLVLLREEMVGEGDADVPIWAVESGWNALPADWEGQPSPWGTDDPAKQADRTRRAVLRARQEWGWLTLLCAPDLQPAVPMDDPRWGFALLGPDAAPTLFYSTWQEAISTPVARLRIDRTSYYARLAVLAVLFLAAAGLLWFSWPRSEWGDWLRQRGEAFLAAPEALQWASVGLLLAGFYFLPSTAVDLALLALACLLVVLRLDIGLACLVFSAPFFLYPKVVLGKAFSMVEILTLLCAGAWLWRWLSQSLRPGARSDRTALPGRLHAALRSLTSLDWAAVALVVLAALSLFVSANRGVSIREFRVIIIEPVLLYFLLRNARLDERQLLRLADALLLAGVAVSAIGLSQYLGHGDVILTEGVRRVHAVYASPNNLSLFLGRVIPLGIAVLAVSHSVRRRAYALALLPLLAGMFLTYSRGGWLLALPAAFLVVGLPRGRRATLLAALVVALCLAALVPLVGTQRLTSLLDWEQGTTFRRVRLWQASLAMLRDHPLTGVGMDNFLYQYPSYMLSDAWQEPGLSHPHNIVLDWWLRLGIAGVAVLLWLEAAFFDLARGQYRLLVDGDARAIMLGWLASMAATLAHGLIDNSYFLVDLAFVFFLTLGWVRAMQAQDASATRPAERGTGTPIGTAKPQGMQ